VFIGWLNIYAAVYNEEYPAILDFSQRYGKQLIFIITAFVLALFVLLIDNRFYFFFAWFIYGGVMLLLLLVLFFGVFNHVSGVVNTENLALNREACELANGFSPTNTHI